MTTTTSLVAALDQGTTSTRCILFDHDGHQVASAQLEHTQFLPRPGWVEHDPAEIWRNSCTVLRSALDPAGIRGEDLVGLGLTNQRETTLLWNRHSGSSYSKTFKYDKKPGRRQADGKKAWDDDKLSRIPQEAA